MLCQHVFHTHIVQICRSPCSWYLNVDCHKQHGELISVRDFIIKLKENAFLLATVRHKFIRHKLKVTLLRKLAPWKNILCFRLTICCYKSMNRLLFYNKNNLDLKERGNTGNYTHFSQILHLSKACVESICVIIAKNIGAVQRGLYPK